MNISPVSNNFRYKNSDVKNNRQTNSIAFKGLINDIESKYRSKKQELAINPVTNKPDYMYTNVASMIYSQRFDEPEKILEAIVDKKTGYVAFDELDGIISLVSKKIGATPFWNFIFKIDNLKSSLRSGLWDKNYGGFLPNEIDYALALNTFKDNEGHFRKRNENFFYSTLKAGAKGYDKNSMISLKDVCEIVELSKDEKGVVNPMRGALGLFVLRTVKNYDIARTFLKFSKTRPDEQNHKIMKTINKELSGSFKNKIANFPCYSRYCFDENGEKIPEMFDFAQSLIDKNDTTYCGWQFVIFANDKEAKDFILENLTDGPKFNWEAYYFGKFINELGTSFSFEEAANYATRYRNVKGTYEGLVDVVQACSFLDDNQEEQIEEYNFFVDSKVLEDIIVFNELMHTANYEGDVNPDYISQILTYDFRAELLPYDDRVQLLNAINVITPLLDECEESPSINRLKEVLPDAVIDLNNLLRKEDISLPISAGTKKEFISKILASCSDNFSDFERTIVDFIPQLEQMTDGIPLKYSREQFIQDLFSISGDIEENMELIKKTGINGVMLSENDDSVVGVNGILTTENLDLSNEKEKKIYDIVNRFLYQNTAQTGNNELDNYLNVIFKAIPEFLSVVQKKQHKTQKYTMDVHMLLAMAYSIQNPEYMQLKQNEKAYLKFAALLHDIAKKEAIIDSGHQYLSSEYVDSIASKFFSHPEIRNKIVEFVCSHHWLAGYNTGESDAVETAFQFRKDGDFKMAKIMAESDLKAVREEFYDRYSHALIEDNMLPIQESIEAFNASLNPYYTHSFVNKAKLKNIKQVFDGKEYSVVDLKKLDDNADVSEFGFAYGTKKSDLKLCVHMVDDEKIDLSLKTVKTLTKPTNQGVVSASIITPDITRTYRNRNHGLLLAQPVNNILAAYQNNIYSGYRKSLDLMLCELCDEDSKMHEYREMFRWKLFARLGIDDSVESAYEYADLAKNYLSKITSISQIDPDLEFELGGKKFNGEALANAINDVNNEIIDLRGLNHNELILYLPRIEGVVSKAESLEEIPEELLEFANANNLPVVLI